MPRLMVNKNGLPASRPAADAAADNEFSQPPVCQPLSDTYQDPKGRMMRLWNLPEAGLTAAVLEPSGRFVTVPGSRIRNGLLPSETGERLCERLAQSGPKAWDLVFRPAPLEVQVWPHMAAAAGTRAKSGGKSVIARDEINWIAGKTIDEVKVGLKKREYVKKNDEERRWVSDPERTLRGRKLSKLVWLYDNGMGGKDRKVRIEPEHWDLIYDPRDRPKTKDGLFIDKKKFPVNPNDPMWREQENVWRRDGDKKLADTTQQKSFEETVQVANISETYNASNPEHPIASGNTAGDIGGVGLDAGLIVGLRDSMSDALDVDSVFVLPGNSADAPITDAEVRQILREVAIGIFCHGKRPIFSLHFNEEGTLFPVIQPEYAGTLVGHVMGMLDYMMKGYLNGGMFEPEYAQRWHETRGANNVGDADRLIDLQAYCKENLCGSTYMSLRELLAVRGVPEQIGLQQLSSSFRIIADSPIVGQGNLFHIGNEFRVEYTIENSPEYADYLRDHQAQHGRPPADYLALTRAYDAMARDIHDKMPRLPCAEKYFGMLNIIQFFVSYFSTLKQMQRVPILTPFEGRPIRPFAPLLPPLPLRYRQAPSEGSFEMTKLAQELTPAERHQAEELLGDAPLAEAPDKLKIPPPLAQRIVNAYFTSLEQAVSGAVGPELLPEPGAETLAVAQEVLKKIQRLASGVRDIDRCPQGRAAPILSDVELLKNLKFAFAVPTSYLDVTGRNAGDPYGNVRVVGGCGLQLKPRRLEPLPSAEPMLAASTIALIDAPHETLHAMKVGGETHWTFKLATIDFAAIGDSDYHFLNHALARDEVPGDAAARDLMMAVHDPNSAASQPPWPIGRDEANDLVHWRDSRGQSLLHHAAHAGEIALGQRLLRHGSDRMWTDAAGNTPLHVAAQAGQRSFVELLLSGTLASWLWRQPQPLLTLRNSYGADALYMASQAGQRACVQKLLASGASATAVVACGLNALTTAMHHGHLDIAIDLVRHPSTSDSVRGGAQGRVQNVAQPLHMACALGLQTVVEALLDAGVERTQPRRDGMTPLHIVARSGDDTISALLLNSGQPLPGLANVRLASGATPLLLAAQQGHEAVIAQLLDHGADSRIRGRNKTSPLIAAIVAGHRGVALRLLAGGTATDLERVQAETGALDVAVRACQGDIVDVLVERGRLDFTVQKDGWRLAHFLAVAGHAGRIERYVAQGAIKMADFDARTAQGQTPFELARNAGKVRVVGLLQQRAWGPVPTDTRRLAQSHARFGHLAGLRTLCRAPGADIEQICDDPASPHHRKSLAYMAAEAGAHSTLAFLLARGARVEYTASGVEMTLLHAAVLSAREACIDMVVPQMADVNRHAGPRAISAAQLAAERGNLAILRHLKRRGVDLHACPRGGNSVLHSAIRAGHGDVVDFLLQDAPPDSVTEALVFAAEQAGPEMVGPLLERAQGANLRHAGRTPLLGAVLGGRLDNVRLLVAKGARGDFKADDVSESALEAAARTDDVDALNIMLGAMAWS